MPSTDLSPLSDEAQFVNLCVSDSFSAAFRAYPHLKPIPAHLKEPIRLAMQARHQLIADNPHTARIADLNAALNTAKLENDHRRVIQAIRLLHDIDPPNHNETILALRDELAMLSNKGLMENLCRSAIIEATAIIDRRVPCSDTYRAKLLVQVLHYQNGLPLPGVERLKFEELNRLKEIAAQQKAEKTHSVNQSEQSDG